MNLLLDQWIPVRIGHNTCHLSYKQLLCEDKPDLKLALPRDDMEMACIQLLSALTQVIFMPSDKRELRDQRVKVPLSCEEYEMNITKFNKEGEEYFDLAHTKHPFMQVLDPETEALTPVQKLFPGLPAGNNHSFFNQNDEYINICPSCAALGLFNLCTLTPNISGKHKGTLRGNAPISTMIYNSDLRKMVWMNVISKDLIDKILPAAQNNIPVWICNILKNQVIQSSSIGILRGLFWTPVLLKLIEEKEAITCNCCGLSSESKISYFILGSDFKYTVNGLWPHLYSPRQLNLNKEKNRDKQKPEESFISFTTTDPAWVQLSELVFQSDRTDKTEGYIPAPVVSQYCELYRDKPVHLIIGGYRNKQASILQRRHELYSLPAGWNDDHREKIKEIVNLGNLAKDILTNKVLYPLIKGDKKKGVKGIQVNIKSNAVSLYYQLTEPYIHKMLRETSLKDYITGKAGFLDEVIRICLQIYKDITKPYANAPEFTGVIALGNRKLEILLKNLKKEHLNIGGDE